MKLAVNRKALALVQGKYEALLRDRRMRRLKWRPQGSRWPLFPKKHIHCIILPERLQECWRDGKEPAWSLYRVFRLRWKRFSESLLPDGQSKSRQFAFFEMSVFLDGIMESTLAPLIERVMQDVPYVYIKSHVILRVLYKSKARNRT